MHQKLLNFISPEINFFNVINPYNTTRMHTSVPSYVQLCDMKLVRKVYVVFKIK